MLMIYRRQKKNETCLLEKTVCLMKQQISKENDINKELE